MIIDKLPEFFLLMSLLHLPLETTSRFIHLRHFFTTLLSLYFLSWILGSVKVSLLVFCFQVLPEIVVDFIKNNIFHFISFHFMLFQWHTLHCIEEWFAMIYPTLASSWKLQSFQRCIYPVEHIWCSAFFAKNVNEFQSRG